MMEALAGLRNKARWFVYRLYGWNGEKYKKEPCALDGYGPVAPGSVGATYDDACAALLQLRARGDTDVWALGFWLVAEDGYWFLDIDAAAAWRQQDAWQRFGTAGLFFEYSSSGKGVHFIGRWPGGQQWEHRSNDGAGLELYSNERGICFGLSGHAWGNADVECLPPIDWMPLRAPGQESEIWHVGKHAECPHEVDDSDTVIVEQLLRGGPRASDAFVGRDQSGYYRLWHEAGKSDGDSKLLGKILDLCGGDCPRAQRIAMLAPCKRDRWLDGRAEPYDNWVGYSLARYMAEVLLPRWRNVAKPAPVVPPLQLPVIADPELRAVAEEFGIQDALEHRGLAGAMHVIRIAGNVEELKSAAARVAAMQQWDAVDREQLAQTLRRKSAELQSPLPLPMCRQLLDPAQDLAMPGQVGAPDWLSEWCYVKSENKFCHMPRGYLMLSRESFDLINATADGVPRKGNGMPGKPSELFPDWRGDVVDMLGFDPRAEQFYKRGAVRYCNAFVGTMPDVEAITPEVQWAIDLYVGHLLALCNGDVEVRDILMQWMARIVQLPGQIARWAIMLIGEEGTGKTMLVKPLIDALGQGNVRVVGAKSINNKGGFMDWAAAGKLLGVLNDFVISGPEKYETAEAIKPVITDDYVTITRKGKVEITYENYANYLANGNSKSPLPITRGARRWYFIRTSQMDQFIERDKAGAAQYFDRLAHAVRALTPGQWRAFWDGVSVAADFPQRAPWSRELENVIANDISEAKHAVMEIVGDAKIVSQDQIGLSLRNVQDAPRGRGVSKLMQELGFNAYAKRIKIGSAPCTVYVHNSVGDVSEDFLKMAARAWSEKTAKERYFSAP